MTAPTEVPTVITEQPEGEMVTYNRAGLSIFTGYFGVQSSWIDGKEIADVRYYNLAGQQVTQPSGLTIQVTTYTTGTRTATKVIKVIKYHSAFSYHIIARGQHP